MTKLINPQRPDAMPVTCLVSIIIKALNEEQRISATIESALQAISELGGIGGEVVLADSCSTDRTVELAKVYSIRLVQLANPEERCCGIGPQLGYQHSRGEFVYILDGDMNLKPGFLAKAISFMRANPRVAGVGGLMIEENTHSLEYIGRTERERYETHAKPGYVDRLNAGGLYRRTAIDAAGYLSDRNLHSYEEFELAVRLRALGWQLWRLPVVAASHYGHDAPPYQLLMRRWRSGYICGLGELVRTAFGQPTLAMVFEGIRELRLYTAVMVWWAVCLSIPFWPLSMLSRAALFGALLVAPLVLMTLRKRSLTKAVYAIVSWSFNTVGTLRGLLRSQRPAYEIIASRIIREPGSTPSQFIPKGTP